MLKRYFIDEVIDTSVPRRQAFNLFSQVSDWADWCPVIRYAHLFGGHWRPGAKLLLVADLPRLPPAPVLVTVLTYREHDCIAWGIDLPLARLVHRFTFLDDGQGECRVHQEEWSEGALTVLTLPLGGLLHRFDQRFAEAFAALF
jgi:hypothetical protein